MTLYEPGTRLAPTQRLPATVALPSSLVTYVKYYRLKKETNEVFGAWTAYTPGVTTLTINNPAKFPVWYDIQFRVDAVYLGEVIEQEFTTDRFLVQPTPQLYIDTFTVTPNPFQEGTVVIGFRAYTVPPFTGTLTIFGDFELFEDGGASAYYESSFSETDLGNGNYSITFTAPAKYAAVTEYGDLHLDITVNPSGTLIPTAYVNHVFTDVWESQPAPAYVCYSLNDIIGTSFTDDSYVENGDSSVVVGAGLNTGVVTAVFDWAQDGYPEETTLQLDSPTGTSIDLSFSGFDATVDGHYELPLTDFAGETSAGEWILRQIDSFGDGGGDVTNISICFGQKIVPVGIPSDEGFGTPTVSAI